MTQRLKHAASKPYPISRHLQKDEDKMKIKSMLIIVLLFFVLLMAGCAPPNLSPAPTPDNALPVTDAPPSDMLITLERTPCYGTCPVYTLSVDATGRVEYDGRDFVAVEGEQIGQISPEQVALLLETFTEAGYFDMKDSYKDWMVSDMPTVITSITLNGKTKRIEHYYGDMHAPEALTKLETKIDEITDSAQWTQKAGEKPQTSEEVIRTLDGTQWNLSGANITLDFKDGVASGNAGCNDYSSSYQIDGKRLTFGMIASNLEMCADEEVMKQEAAFLQALRSVFAFELIPDGMLILFGEEGTLVFTPAQSILLQGHDWTLEGISQGQAIVQNWIDKTITIRFEGEKVSGSTGCNRYFGIYEVDGDKLTIGPVSATYHACDEEHAQREVEFLEALKQVDRYAINRMTLTLFDDKGMKLMVFGLQ